MASSRAIVNETLLNGPDSRVPARTLDGARVLVVEDDLDARDMLMALLALAKADVEGAASVAEGLAKLQAGRPFDLVLSDIGMPDEDGYVLIDRLRALPAPLGSTPAIALTAFARGEDRSRALSSGFDAHVAKPIEPDALVTLAVRVLAQTPPVSMR